MMSSTEEKRPPGRVVGRSRLRALLFVLGALFIVVTSCTVVRPQEFFDWIHQHLIRSDAFFASFQVFLGLSWFAIVKGWHACEFAILLLFAVSAMNWFTARRTARNIAIGIVFCLAFAALDEWHQTFVPGRGGTVTDVLIDSLGALVAAWFLLRRPQRSGPGANGIQNVSQNFASS